MKTRSYYPVLLAVFMIGSAVSQNVEELLIPEETDNLFPPERSESNSHNEGSESTNAGSTQGTSEYVKADVTTSTLTNEDEKIVDSTDPPPESPVEDVVPRTTTKGNDNEDNEITAADGNQEMSGTTITDVPIPTLANNDVKVTNDVVSESTTSKPDGQTSESTVSDETESTLINDDQGTIATIQTTFGSTISDELAPALAKDDLQVTYDGGSETTAPESTEQTSTAAYADVLAPALASNDSPITYGEGTAINAEEINEPTSTKADGLALAGVVQLSDHVDSESTAAETKSTQTPLGSSTDEDEATLQNEEKVSTNEDSETTVAETTQMSGFKIIDEASTTSANTDEQMTTTESSETTAEESAYPNSGSTIKDDHNGDDMSTMSASNDQVPNSKGSETTAESPNEVVDLSKSMNAVEQATTTSTSLELTCPKSCVCITEADSNNYIVDCSDRALTDLPGPIDPKTTILKLQNNFLTNIPKEISELKNLKVLNASDNSIFDLDHGSISELSELVTLNLANNRLHEYPQELQYPLALNKLEELDLAGNDLIAIPRFMLNLIALQTITLPEASSKLAADLCLSLKETLVTVCSKSCEVKSFKCSDAFVQPNGELPGMIPFIPKRLDEDSKNLEDISANTKTSDMSITSPVSKTTEGINTETKETKSGIKENVPVSEFSLRTAVNNAPKEKVALQSIIIDTTKDSSNNETDVKLGAKTAETKAAGGVDKSVIAVIVAGMVIIIAVITIKKNWSSLRKRFGSTPRPNDRSVRNTNGTTPEEVPLQDKSPV